MIIGFVCGCFDLFHIGHLNLLKAAKNECDYLIVGVHTDDAIIKHKQHNPLIAENERLEIVKAIRYVDEAHLISKELEDRLNFCKQYNIDIIFAGDDWKGSTFYNELIKSGIQVKFFPYTQGISTTQLREKLK